MPSVRAYDEIPAPKQRVKHEVPGGYYSWRTGFLNDRDEKTHDGHQAFLAEGASGRLLRTHFHRVDQFQVIALGDGTLGHHGLKFGAVHFARSYTPYGPIVYGKEGLGFMTLRARYDTAKAHYIPDKREILEGMPNRKPFQVSAAPDLDLVPDASGVASKAIEGLKDDRGLGGISVALKPGARFLGPDPSTGDGQYVVVLKGSISYQGKEEHSPAVVWVGKDESRFELVGGEKGCTALVLNFPEPTVQDGPAVAEKPKADESAAASYHCVLCGYVYDEAAGAPDLGVPAGTRWKDVPEDFKCPDCSATKPDFEALEF